MISQPTAQIPAPAQPAPAQTAPAPPGQPEAAPPGQPEPPAAAPTRPDSVPVAPSPRAAPPSRSASTPKPQAGVAPKTLPHTAVAASASPAAATPGANSAAAPGAAVTLDLSSLEQRLRDTRAIGVFTKLSLKNQVDDLLDDLRDRYKRGDKRPAPELRQRYDLLLMKVLTLLQDGDPPLATAIASSREAIWSILADPDKFEKI